MSRIQWLLQRWVRLAGWPGAAGAALIAFGAALYFGGLMPLQGRIAELRQAVAAATPGRAKPEVVNADQGPAARLAAFYRFFPGRAGVPDALARIYAAAGAAGLTLDQGEYKSFKAPEGGLERLQVTLPVKGTYGQVRRFVAEVLNRVPIAALDDVSFKRDAIGSDILQAEIRFSLYTEGQ